MDSQLPEETCIFHSKGISESHILQSKRLFYKNIPKSKLFTNSFQAPSPFSSLSPPIWVNEVLLELTMSHR